MKESSPQNLVSHKSLSLDILQKKGIKNNQKSYTFKPPNVKLTRSFTFRPIIKKSIDIYSITDCVLGTSSFSSVYLGYNNSIKKKVAVKFIQGAQRMDGDSVIENEVNLLRKMKESERIVRLENFLTDEQRNCYMIFELADYNLLNYMSVNGSFFDEEGNVRNVFKKIVEAVGDLHEKNIVHRDMKLENVFVFNSKGTSIKIKIGDLGLSTVCERNQVLTQYCGSPLYSAPEVNKGIPYNGYKYDIWSLGIILYYLVYGYFPFNVFKNEITHDDLEEDEIKTKIITLLFQKIQTEELTFIEEKKISENCKSLIQTLLNKDPERRPFIEEVIKHSFFKKD
jgi:serine/threonine protein kinase